MTYSASGQVQREYYSHASGAWWRIMKIVRYVSITYHYMITWLSVRKRNGILTRVWRGTRSRYAALDWWRVSFVSTSAILKHPLDSIEMSPILKNVSKRESTLDWCMPVVIGHHIYETFPIPTRCCLSLTISCINNYYIGLKSHSHQESVQIPWASVRECNKMGWGKSSNISSYPKTDSITE